MNTSDLEKKIDVFAHQAMQQWNVPGLGLVIVKDDQVLLSKGYGIREIGKPEKVDEHTLFAIGSNTKAFTAAAVGLLVQEGKLAWDDPVTKYLPGFKLYDHHATELMSIRDLLCHRCGLGTWAGDMLLLSNYATEEIIQRLRYIPPAYSFRAGYGYSNLMFITAGQVIAAVSGVSWDEFIQRRIFEPLGLRESVTNPRYFGSYANVATPHEDVRGNLQTVVYRDDAHVGAAGSICASVADISLWMRLHLAMGSLNGHPFMDPAIAAEMQSPHTTIGLTAIERQLFPSRHFSAYGLGWFLSDFHGRLTVRHTGGVDGMLSNIVMLPEEKLGVAVFTNKLPNFAYVALPHFIIESMLGVSSQDWMQAYMDLDLENKQKAEQDQKHRDDSRMKDTRPSLAWEKYVGEYESDILGGATVSAESSGFHIQLQAHGSISGRLEHWHHDTFLCKWDDPVLGESLMPFISNGQGEVAEFRVQIREDWIDPLQHVFRKK